MPPAPRIRITVSLNKELADQVDELIDGVRIRNRSHAVESLIKESLGQARVRHAVILAGGDDVRNRLPAIRHFLSTLSEYDVTEIFVAVGYLGETVKEALGDGTDFGVRLTYLDSDRGTGGVLRQYRTRFKSTFLVANLHRPVDVDVRQLLRFHREHQPAVTIATPSLTELHGVYVFEPKALAAIPDGFAMLEETVFHELTKAGKLLPYPIVTER